MDSGGSELDSSFSQTENPCLMVEDSQPDSVALEDDPNTSYSALLGRRLSSLHPTAHSPVLDKSDTTAHSDNSQSNLGLAATEHSQVFEVCSFLNPKRVKEHMESEANSTTHCTETQNEMSQFGLLELSESQGVHDDQLVGAPENQRDSQKLASQRGLKSSERSSQDGSSRGLEVRSSSSVHQDGETRKLSVQDIMHSQVPDSQENEDDNIISSQDDLFEKEGNGTKADNNVLPTSTPAESLRLLHLSGQGKLVQESLSQQSVDYVAATQDNLNQTPYIVPNSPTEKQLNYNEAADSSMNTSGPSEHQPKKREVEPVGMDTYPKPQPSASTPVSQNSPVFVLDKSLSVPTQPEFSHDVFISTPSLEPQNNSQSSNKKLLQQNSPSITESGSPNLTDPPERGKKSSSSFSQPSEVTEGFQLQLSSENNSSQKTQAFIVEEDSQATQIEEVTVGVDKDNSNSKYNPQHASKKGVDPKADKTTPEMVETCNSQRLSQSGNIGKRDISITSGVSQSQLSASADCVSDTPSLPPKSKTIDLTSVSSSQTSADRPGSCSPAPLPSQSQSLPVLNVSSQKNTENEKAHVSQRLSQPVMHSHSVITDSVRNTEEEEQMDKAENHSSVKSEDTRLNLALSQSQLLSPQLMEEDEEEGNGGQEKEIPVPTRDLPSFSKEESFSVMELEESQRVSQEKVKDRRSQPFISFSQPVRSSTQDKLETKGKILGSQPQRTADDSPVQLERKRSQSTKVSDAGQLKDLNRINLDNATNKSLSDSSGELPFHFTLPKEGELICPAVSATPPQISLLKKTPRHSTPIEMTSFSEPPEGDVTRETTMAASEISIESREGEEPAAVEGGGKLSLRMKLVTPVDEGSSEHFSLQKPSLTDEEGPVSKATTVVMAVTSPSVFSRVREAHRQVQWEDNVESSDLPLSRQQSQIRHSPPNTNDSELSPNRLTETVGNKTSDCVSEAVPHQSWHPHGTGGLSSPAGEQEVKSASKNTSSQTPVRQRAVSQQTSVDITSTTNQPSQGEPSTPTKSQPSVHRHVRTIQEVRTTVTRIITDVYYEDGREIDRKVTHESEEPTVDRCVVDNDISPCRTGSSMTSGDLADVSSLFFKATSHHSSGASSGGLGPTRMHDFIMPPSQGGKSSRGGQTGLRGGVQVASSSEEEPYVQKHTQAPGSPVEPSATSLSDSLNTTSPENSTVSSSFVGLRVLAKWSSNSYFYSGSITRDLGQNRFRLLFDDNQECEVQGRDILLCDPIPLETEVTALTKEAFFNIGIVKGHKTQGSEFLYCVEKDGQTVWYNRASVILSMEQGSRLREQYGLGPYEPSTPKAMASDISLDNLVEGKRRCRGNLSGTGTPNRSFSNSPRTPGPSGKRKLISGTEDERSPAKRGRKGGRGRLGMMPFANGPF